MTGKTKWGVGIAIALLYLSGAGWAYMDILTAGVPPVPAEQHCADQGREKEYTPVRTSYSYQLYRHISPYDFCVERYVPSNDRQAGALFGATAWPVVQTIRAGMKAFQAERKETP